MRGTQVLIITALVSGLVLAGCVDDAEPPEAPVDEPEFSGPRSLAELACEFTYPDNETQIPCENQVPETSLAMTTRPGTATATVESQEPWVCVKHTSEQAWGYSIHWDPETDRYGMYYEFDEVDRPLDAVLFSRDGSVAITLYGIDPIGFIELPEIPDSGPPENLHSLNFAFYIHDYVTDTPELQDGEIRALWTMWEGRPYPIHEITTGNQSYYFHNVSVGKGEGGIDIYKPQTFALQGQDYNVTIQYVEQKALQIGWNPNPELCALI